MTAAINTAALILGRAMLAFLCVCAVVVVYGFAMDWRLERARRNAMATSMARSDDARVLANRRKRSRRPWSFAAMHAVQEAKQRRGPTVRADFDWDACREEIGI
jgi:hypothetical protein